MSSPTKAKPPDALLRRRDQRPLLVLVASLLALVAAVWWRHGAHRGEMIEIDRAAPLTARFQVDVNAAGWPELVQLPGIGRTLAERLVEERGRGGAFRDHEDLQRVEGVGPRTLERIRPYLLPIPPESNLVTR